MLNELFIKYETQLRFILYGFFFAFLGYFMATMPMPLSGAVGMTCALVIIDELRKIEWIKNFDWLTIGYGIGLILLMFISPPAIISTPGIMYAGVILSAIVSAVIVSPKLTNGFKVLIILLTSVFPSINVFTAIAYIMLSDTLVFNGYILIYIVTFIASHILINKKDLLK